MAMIFWKLKIHNSLIAHFEYWPPEFANNKNWFIKQKLEIFELQIPCLNVTNTIFISQTVKLSSWNSYPYEKTTISMCWIRTIGLFNSNVIFYYILIKLKEQTVSKRQHFPFPTSLGITIVLAHEAAFSSDREYLSRWRKGENETEFI